MNDTYDGMNFTHLT